MILPIYYYRVSKTIVALESSFSGHLKLLKSTISPVFHQFIVGMIEMDVQDYENKKQGLALIDEQTEGIVFKSICRKEDLSSGVRQMLKLFLISGQFKEWIDNCDVLHTGLSANVWFPMEFVASLWGFFLKKTIVYVVDIDFRKSAQMNYRTGKWSLKSYILCKYIYDKFREFQVDMAVNQRSLVLLKGKKLCQDFGKGKPEVKNFLDAAHSEHHIINSDALKQKLIHLRNQNHPLELVYFGRLTYYKGVDRCIQAVAIARQKMGCNVLFHVIGEGEEAKALQKLTQELAIEDSVRFYGALPFNQNFFEKLYAYHLLLAAPLSEDTPRSALDAMAAGIPILAFDTYYYQDLTSTGAVDTVPWLSVEQLAERIVFYDKNRELLSKMVRKAIDCARQNTQEKWLKRRFDWTLNHAGLQ